MEIILAIIVWEIAKRTFKYTTIYQEWFKKSKGTVEKSNSLQEELEIDDFKFDKKGNSIP